MRQPSWEEEGTALVTYFHGTDATSATSLANGAPLDVQLAAAMKIDGPPGFFLASIEAEAEFFAFRRNSAAVLRFDASEHAVTQLRIAGAAIRPIPRGPRSPYFQGDELFIPVSAFALFDQLRQSGDIIVVQ